MKSLVSMSGESEGVGETQNPLAHSIARDILLRPSPAKLLSVSEPVSPYERSMLEPGNVLVSNLDVGAGRAWPVPSETVLGCHSQTSTALWTEISGERGIPHSRKVKVEAGASSLSNSFCAKDYKHPDWFPEEDALTQVSLAVTIVSDKPSARIRSSESAAACVPCSFNARLPAH